MPYAPAKRSIIIIAGWAMIINIQRDCIAGNWLLFSIGIAVFLLQVWMVIEGAVVYFSLTRTKITALKSNAYSQ